MLIVPAAAAADMENQAYEHLKDNEWTQARRAFENELVIHPKNLEARYNLALLMARAGHPDDEKAFYLENLRYGWHLPSVVNLSAIYSAEGNNLQAHQLLEKASKHFRFEATPLYLLAELDEKAGNRAAAAARYDQALKVDPLNGYAQIRYARFLAEEKQFDAAVKHGERAVVLLPGSASTLATFADILVAVGKNEQAVESYQKSLAIQPDPQTRQRLIDLLHKLGDHERADRMQQALDAWLMHQGP